MPYYEHGDDSGDPGAVICGAWIGSAGKWFRPDPIDKHMLIWVLDGSAHIETEGESFEISSNGLFCARPDAEYVVRWGPRRATWWGWLIFSPKDGVEPPRTRLGRADDLLIPLLNHMVALSIDKPPAWRTSIRRVYDYAVDLYASGDSSTRIAHDSVYSELVVRALSAVQVRWHNSTMSALPVADLAAELGVTPRHLTRVFDREIGFGPITVLRMLRILRGAQLLIETNRPIREIAHQVGFANPYHFAAVFKSTIGVPPGRYREKPPEQALVPPRVEQLLTYI